LFAEYYWKYLYQNPNPDPDATAIIGQKIFDAIIAKGKRFGEIQDVVIYGDKDLLILNITEYTEDQISKLMNMSAEELGYSMGYEFPVFIVSTTAGEIFFIAGNAKYADDIFRLADDIIIHSAPDIDLHKAVSEWARLQRSLASKTQLRRFNTATVVRDTRTGRLYYGMNRGLRISGDKLNPQLASRLPKESMEEWALGNCAEVDAVNQALSSGARWVDLEMHTIGIRPDGTIFGKPQCANCLFTFEGVPVR
jgi:hypothetical protein